MKVKIGCASSLQEYKGLEFSLKANSQYVWDPLLFACILLCRPLCKLDFPGGSDGKASVYNAGDPDSIPGLGRSTGEGNGNPLQYYCLENPMDRGAW